MASFSEAPPTTTLTMAIQSEPAEQEVSKTLQVVSLTTSTSDPLSWASGTSYKVGGHVTFDNKVFECIQAHNSQTDWTPIATPALPLETRGWAEPPVENPTPPGGEDPPATKPTTTVLPYASELFGVYQPLTSWKSQLSHEILSKAVSFRVQGAVLQANKLSKINPPKLMAGDEEGWSTRPRQMGRTGTRVGRSIVDDDALDVNEYLSNITTDGLFAKLPPRTTPKVALLLWLQLPPMRQATVGPASSRLSVLINGAGFFSDDHPAKNVYLSPLGLMHQFRDYFFQLGTFLGPPVGHVWISPGGSVEPVEVNTRRQVVEQVVEQSLTTTAKTELDRTDKDELSDAVKSENSNDIKLGASATASGGIGFVFQASGTASLNLDITRKQAQEQTHRKMREQSARLSSEVQQNYKTTFRTVTELTDTSSRRYVLQNQTDKLVSYELSLKMRKLAVQVQDLGQRLCWQMYAKVVSDAFPYILKTGDKELEEDFTPDLDHSGWGMHENGTFESNDRIEFLLDFHGTAVKWVDDLQPNRIDNKNNENKQAYSDALQAEREKSIYDTLRARLKVMGQVATRSQEDMRRRYGTEDSWKNDDYYAASEMIRYFFDIDAILYFVAPD
ncbi:hypothetical protein B0H63DRAFT_541603 [Podospora didyma]|uniref:Chitin-binding type-3 domain-containing protein n=1 Tax=Podospora didyma TaxID=330526 RepID=A0AAE0U1F5_9PEZI|nr:hypothetical protein B0H63DRAFT_541603 [Podospora didyma]